MEMIIVVLAGSALAGVLVGVVWNHIFKMPTSKTPKGW